MKWAACLLFLLQTAAAMPTNEKTGKAFSLFNVVTFPNLQCTSMMDNMLGTCLTAEECNARDGDASGNCASGFGVCCLKMVSLPITGGSQTISYNRTYITSDNFPTTFGGTGVLAAATYSFPFSTTSDIQHIRLDFDTGNFEAPALADGDCAGHDQITYTTPVTAGSVGFEALCGHLTGSHVYLETGSAVSGNQLQIATTATNFIRSWKILISFIESGNVLNPPSGCRQYYYGPTGRIQSLNYVDAAGALATLLQHSNYDVCVRPEAGAKCLQLSEAGGAVDSFAFADAAAAGQSTVAAAGNVATCNDDYIDFADTATPQLTRRCGDTLNPITAMAVAAPVQSTRFRFTLRVATAARRAAGSGYDLTYSQLSRCS